MLDEFVAITGYHRKHAIRILNTVDAGAPRRHGGRRLLYDEAVRQTLTILWEASDRTCGTPLRANIAETILLAGFSEQGEKKDQREA